jgi:hypothetical protein
MNVYTFIISCEIPVSRRIKKSSITRIVGQAVKEAASKVRLTIPLIYKVEMVVDKILVSPSTKIVADGNQFNRVVDFKRAYSPFLREVVKRIKQELGLSAVTFEFVEGQVFL